MRARKRRASGPAVAIVATEPRLLNYKQAAGYLGVSPWTCRDWILAGHIPIVELWPLRPREGERARTTLRRVLIDRADLDALIEARKRRESA